MDKHVSDQIVWSLADRLEAERDPIRRHALRTLLIEEEDRFGEAAERLDRAEAHIASSVFRIEELEKAIAHRKARGADVGAAERSLALMKEVLGAFDVYRTQLLESLDRSPI